MIRGGRTTFADQGPASTVIFFQITGKIFKFETCRFKVIARNIKAIFRENVSLLRFDSGKIFKIVIFTRGPRTTYCIAEILRNITLVGLGFWTANGRDALIGRFEWTRIVQIPLVENFAPIMLRKLLLRLQDRFSRKILEGWSSNSAQERRNI